MELKEQYKIQGVIGYIVLNIVIILNNGILRCDIKH